MWKCALASADFARLSSQIRSRDANPKRNPPFPVITSVISDGGRSAAVGTAGGPEAAGARPRLPGDQAAELGHVGGGELVEGVRAEQLHGADDLVGEDRDGPVDAGPPAGHEAVQVGAADEGEPRAEGD